MKRLVVLICISIFVFSCKEEKLPKPKSYLTLQYPSPTYERTGLDCPYSFEISNYSEITVKKNCWSSLRYPELKATVHITYRAVDNNLNEILKEIEKLTFEHTVKADAIHATPFENLDKQVFGKLYSIEGNVATNVQFKVTDSVHHVLAGALYFYTKPNYDSILPAIKYIEKDLKHLMETVIWK